MSEPSRPPPPKAYVPSRPKEVDPSSSTTGKEPPIPPRPPPEAIPSDDGPPPQRPNKRMTGPPPPPTPYGKKDSDVSQSLPPKRAPPPVRSTSGTALPRPPSGPSRPTHPTPTTPTSLVPFKRNSREITIVSAQPMSSDVIPPPSTSTNQDHSSSDRKVPPPRRGPPPKAQTGSGNIPSDNLLDQATPTLINQPTIVPDKDPPPPAYPAPPPPTSEPQYPPKPTSPPPPLPMERVKRSSVSKSPGNNPIDDVIDIGGVAANNGKKPSEETQSIPKQETSRGPKPPLPPSYSTKSKPPLPLGPVVIHKTEETIPTEEPSDDGKKPRPKPPPVRKGPPPVSSSSQDIVPDIVRKLPPPRKNLSALQVNKETPPAKETQPTNETPPTDKTPPTNETPPTDETPLAKETKDSPSTRNTSNSPKPIKRAPPPRRGPPPSDNKKPSPDGNRKESGDTPPPSRKAPPSPGTRRDNSEKPKRAAPRPPPPKSSDSTKPLPPKARTDPKQDKESEPMTESVSEPSVEKTKTEITRTKSSPSSSPTITKHSPPSKPAPSKPAPSKPAPSKPAPSKPDKSPPPLKPTPPSAAPRKTAPTKPGPPKPGPPKPGPPKPGPPKPGPSRPDTGPPKPGPPKPRAGKPPTSVKRSTPVQDQPPALPPRPAAGHPLYKYVCSVPHAIACNNHEAEEADELSYMEGDVIELIEKIDDYWYWARNADNEGAEGLIGAADMKIVRRLPGEDKVAGFEDGPCAVASNAFEAMQKDELSFTKNDLIMLISRIGDGQWLRGRNMQGQEGIFPSSFVEIVEDLPPDAIESPPAIASPEPAAIPDGPYCVAIETFDGETSDDLSFQQGDVIILTERVDDSWLRGSVNGLTGMFPQVFVDVRVDISVGVVKPKEAESSVSTQVIALFDFVGQSEEELTFKNGDKISVTHRVNDEWVYGTFNGSHGMFPSAFIDQVPDNLPLKDDEENTPTKTEESAKSGSTDLPSTSNNAPPTSPGTGKCEAVYDFEAGNEGELSFTIGEVITTTEWISDEWVSGRTGDREGMFPLAFVKVIEELPKATTKDLSSKTNSNSSSSKNKGGTSDDLLPRGVATGHFEPRDSSEITVKVGDECILLSKETPKMYLGENLRTGDLGCFPINIIDVQIPLP